MVALDQYKISPEIIKISKHHIKPNQIDSDAKSIIKKLNKGGFKGFIVGGFVRDSILGLQPKDCDVVTDATPEEIKNLLPRTRIIGRRFKIVHARSGRNITEISTFRSSSKKDIQKSFKRLYSKNFQKLVNNVNNPYDNGSSSKKIIRILKNFKLKNILKKNFYNIEFKL